MNARRVRTTAMPMQSVTMQMEVFHAPAKKVTVEMGLAVQVCKENFLYINRE